MNPKLKGVLARATLVGGVALVASLVARSAPHEQVITIRLPEGDVRHIEGIVTREDDDEPTAGFSRDFPEGTRAPGRVEHRFSAPNGTYIVVITLRREGAPQTSAGASTPRGAAPREESPIPSETSFQRRVSLAGGEVIVSPD